MRILYVISSYNDLDILKHTLTTNLLKILKEGDRLYIKNVNNSKCVSKYIRDNFNSSINSDIIQYGDTIDYMDIFKQQNIEYVVDLHESEFIGKISKELKQLDLETTLIRNKTKGCRKQLFILNNFSVPLNTTIQSQDKSVPIGG